MNVQTILIERSAFISRSERQPTEIQRINSKDRPCRTEQWQCALCRDLPRAGDGDVDPDPAASPCLSLSEQRVRVFTCTPSLRL